MELFFIDKNNLAEAVRSARQGKRTLIISDSNVEALNKMMLPKGGCKDIDIRKTGAFNALSEWIKEIQNLNLYLDDTLNPTLLHLKKICDKDNIENVYVVN